VTGTLSWSRHQGGPVSEALDRHEVPLSLSTAKDGSDKGSPMPFDDAFDGRLLDKISNAASAHQLPNMKIRSNATDVPSRWIPAPRPPRFSLFEMTISFKNADVT
jgi:hypothetical protein